ncbi:hypothetical protein [Escherichia coli]|uniref:hypothetical protein n=1 Tax=Escherichia coli TaxID=562 RepID=UPI003F773823
MTNLQPANSSSQKMAGICFLVGDVTSNTMLAWHQTMVTRRWLPELDEFRDEVAGHCGQHEAAVAGFFFFSSSSCKNFFWQHKLNEQGQVVAHVHLRKRNGFENDGFFFFE